MDNTINSTIIEKVIIKNVAIYKAIGMLPQPQFEDKFRKEILCQQNENTQKQNLENNLNEPEKRIEPLQNVDMNETKIVKEQENWRTITDPKLREKMRKKVWNDNNKNYFKEYYKKNKTKKSLYHKQWYEKNKNRLKEKEYRETNKVRIKEYKRNWGKKNRQKINKARRDRLQTDTQYKLSVLLRKRMCTAIKNNYKSGSAVKDLGCTIEELKSYLESKFQPGMNWNNWSKDGWHIDHIKPLASFDLSNRKQMLEACHYTNLQPLWAKDNLSKSDNLL